MASATQMRATSTGGGTLSPAADRALLPAGMSPAAGHKASNDAAITSGAYADAAAATKHAKPSRTSLYWRRLQRSRGFVGCLVRCGRRPAPRPQTRVIAANDADANDDADYADNTVVTSRYTWYSFVPLFLFEQFSRFANFYFLVVRTWAL
jgi:hypothetical protein